MKQLELKVGVDFAELNNDEITVQNGEEIIQEGSQNLTENSQHSHSKTESDIRGKEVQVSKIT